MSAKKKMIAIIGGGPAGLMAAEVLSQSGYVVNVFDAMPSMARKFLRAGIGGLNITYDEPLEIFLDKYAERRNELIPLLNKFSPQDLITWVHNLGIETFIGSSHRVFPREKKAAPLLRAWLHRLRQAGVIFHPRHYWLGWNEESFLRFNTVNNSEVIFKSDATLLALGGASWPQLGSDGNWVKILAKKGIEINPLRSSNCGFVVAWSEFFREKFAGQPIKAVTASIQQSNGEVFKKAGELMVSKTGIEGGLIYALSAIAREEIERNASVTLYLDLNPDRTLEQITLKLSEPKGKNTLAKHLKNKLNIDGVKAALLREYSDHTIFSEPKLLAKLIKAFPLTLIKTNPIAEAISTAGGVKFEELNPQQMLIKMPGVFCAGEMLDWEAPTGGYLLSACIASGFAAGKGMLQSLQLS